MSAFDDPDDLPDKLPFGYDANGDVRYDECEVCSWRHHPDESCDEHTRMYFEDDIISNWLERDREEELGAFPPGDEEFHIHTRPDE